MKTKDLIFEKYYKHIPEFFRFKELPEDLQPEDQIIFRVDDRYYGENEDEYAQLLIYRERDMNEEEMKKYKEDLQNILEKSKKQRYEQYLKLKYEFEKD